MKIEILGPGCTRCRATEDTVRKALAALGMQADIVHVSDPVQISRRGVMLTPGVLVDGAIKSSGKVPSIDEVKGWLSHPTSR